MFNNNSTYNTSPLYYSSKKRSRLAWVGRKVLNGDKKVDTIELTKFSSSTSNQQQQQPPLSPQTKNSNNYLFKKTNKIDWTENAKLGTHFWADLNNQQSNCSCYLNEPDALEFHKLDNSLKCKCSSKNETKKKCIICKIVAHDSCIDLLQQHVKCRLTYREANNKNENEPSSNALDNKQNYCNSHHWIFHNNQEKTCKKCLKSCTNRFGLQTSHPFISCSWCKAAYHLKCFTSNLHEEECSLGEFNQLIIPPSWIVKSRSNFKISSTNSETMQNSLALTKPMAELSQPATNMSISQFNSSFIIRPHTSNQNNSLTSPLIVLINPKSGSKFGQKILKKFTWLLNARQVFDITLPGGPSLPNVPNLKVLVGGGDGTFSWVLSVIDQIKFSSGRPSVAVLPLGTGNDLARTLNWGRWYIGEPLTNILKKIDKNKCVKLDRWKITSTPIIESISSEGIGNNRQSKTVEKLLNNNVINNYFSIGADAHVALEFHEKREANPQKYSNRWLNFLYYLEDGSKDFVKKAWRNLKDVIQLECDNKNYTDFVRAKGYHCIVVLNITSMYAGKNPWRNSPKFKPQSINDGLLEVIGCFTSTLTKIQFGGTGERICQAKHIKIVTNAHIPIQIDGEAAKLCPSFIEITHKNQAKMLENVKFNKDNQVLDLSNSIISRNIEVSCILKEDYDKFITNKKIEYVEEKAIYIGAICTSNLTDNLIKVKSTINLLIKNCANGFYTEKWSFLNGEDFCKISDDSDECLLDILASFDEAKAISRIYILDESSILNTNAKSDKNMKEILI